MDQGTDKGRCPKCGALLALVGRIHNCRSTSSPAPKDYGPGTPIGGTTPLVNAKEEMPKKKAKREPKSKAVKKKERFDRLKYQRDYMRKKRAKERAAKEK